MNPLFRLMVPMVLLTALAGAVGGWVGVRIGMGQVPAHSGLNELIHRELPLTAAQTRKVQALEATFDAQRHGLETEMRAANADLAEAITTEHAYGPRAQQAIARFHAAMGVLQEDTIKHVLAMRAVMTPDQVRRFDRLVKTALEPPAA